VEPNARRLVEPDGPDPGKLIEEGWPKPDGPDPGKHEEKGGRQGERLEDASASYVGSSRASR
jgi:hypothetical protein